MHRDWRSRSTAADSVSDRGRDGLDGGAGDGGRAQPDPVAVTRNELRGIMPDTRHHITDRVSGAPLLVWRAYSPSGEPIDLTYEQWHAFADASGHCDEHRYAATHCATCTCDSGTDPSTHSRAHDGSYP